MCSSDLALIALLEFVRLSVLHEKDAAENVIKQHMKIDEDEFSSLVSRGILMAVKNAQKLGKSIQEILLDFRQFCFEHPAEADEPAEDDTDSDDDDDADEESDDA